MRPAEAGRGLRLPEEPWARAGARGRFVFGGEDNPTQGLVAGVGGAAGEKDLAGVGGGFAPWEGGAAGGLVGIGPGGVVVEARGEAEDDEGRILQGGRGGGGGGIDGCIGGVGTGDGGAGATPGKAGKTIRQE